jgi:hypothetical protein
MSDRCKRWLVAGRNADYDCGHCDSQCRGLCNWHGDGSVQAETVYRLLGEGPRGNKIKATVVRETRVRFRLSEL